MCHARPSEAQVVNASPAVGRLMLCSSHFLPFLGPQDQLLDVPSLPRLLPHCQPVLGGHGESILCVTAAFSDSALSSYFGSLPH